MPQQTTVGVVLFLSGRDAGGISGGAVKKNMALMGESKEKTLGLKGRPPKNSFKFCSDGICNNAN